MESVKETPGVPRGTPIGATQPKSTPPDPLPVATDDGEPGHEGGDEDLYPVEASKTLVSAVDALQYRVKWAGYTESDWQPAAEFVGSKVAERFRDLYPYKPKLSQ